MFARKVCVSLKPNALTRFTSLMESELLPWLRTQEGFLDLITLAAPDGIEVQAISFWERDSNAQSDSGGYPERVLGILEALLDGSPYGKTFEVVTSTLEKFAPLNPQEKGSVAPGTKQPQIGYGSYRATL